MNIGNKYVLSHGIFRKVHKGGIAMDWSINTLSMIALLKKSDIQMLMILKLKLNRCSYTYPERKDLKR